MNQRQGRLARGRLDRPCSLARALKLEDLVLNGINMSFNHLETHAAHLQLLPVLKQPALASEAEIAHGAKAAARFQEGLVRVLRSPTDVEDLTKQAMNCDKKVQSKTLTRCLSQSVG